MAPRAGPRSALQAGLSAVVAGLAALTLLVIAAPDAHAGVGADRPSRRTLQADGSAPVESYDTLVDFGSIASGFINDGCSDMPAAAVWSPPATVNGAIKWGRWPLNRRQCSSVSFHSAWGCAGRPSATYLRPESNAPTTM
ncbi:unnamed protein product [Closterium sp. Yama58-4]|nr:unnamed protein product [Closterium sp. Yama58-4]